MTWNALFKATFRQTLNSGLDFLILIVIPWQCCFDNLVLKDNQGREDQLVRFPQKKQGNHLLPWHHHFAPSLTAALNNQRWEKRSIFEAAFISLVVLLPAKGKEQRKRASAVLRKNCGVFSRAKEAAHAILQTSQSCEEKWNCNKIYHLILLGIKLTLLVFNNCSGSSQFSRMCTTCGPSRLSHRRASQVQAYLSHEDSDQLKSQRGAG